MLFWSRQLYDARQRRIAVRLMAVCLALSGCAVSPDSSVNLPMEAPPHTLQQWSVIGKAALSHAGDTDTVNLTWERLNSNRDRVTVSGPLGAGLRTIERHSQTIYEYRNDTSQPLDLQQLPEAQSALLRALPVAALGDTLLRGQALSDDWRVTVSEWTTAQRWRVPRKLTVKSAEVTLQVVLLRWTFPEVDG